MCMWQRHILHTPGFTGARIAACAHRLTDAKVRCNSGVSESMHHIDPVRVDHEHVSIGKHRVQCREHAPGRVARRRLLQLRVDAGASGTALPD